MQNLSVRQRLKLKLGFALLGWMLIGLALLLTGCATTSTAQLQPPQTPPPPALVQPLPSESYLQMWKQRAENWRKRVTDMQTMSER